MTTQYEFELLQPGKLIPDHPTKKPHNDRPLSRLQAMILMAFEKHGSMIDEQLISLPEFNGMYGPTIWKRRSELAERGRLVPAGKQLNSRGSLMTIWGLNR